MYTALNLRVPHAMELLIRLKWAGHTIKMKIGNLLPGRRPVGKPRRS